MVNITNWVFSEILLLQANVANLPNLANWCLTHERKHSSYLGIVRSCLST